MPRGRRTKVTGQGVNDYRLRRAFIDSDDDDEGQQR